MNDILTAALAAARLGWPVFMLARSKRPVANCDACRTATNHDPATCGHLTCHGFYAAATDPHRVAANIAAIPYGQLAVRTGAVSGLLVVDVDPAHGGTTSMTHLMTEQLLPRTRRVVTGSGGHHLYYRHPGQPMPSRPMPGRPGIDIKADGGYVVLPPSSHHRTGLPYRWATSSGPGAAEMPPALVAACLPPMPADSSTPQTPSVSTQKGGGISHPDKLLDSLLDAVRRAGEGHRRTTLYGAARGVARMVAAGAIEYAAAVAALTRVGREAEQTEREIRAAIAGGFRDEGIAA